MKMPASVAPPLLSVIITTFDRPRLLEGTLRRLRSRCLRKPGQISHELIVADDGSTDPEQLALLETCAADMIIRNGDKTRGPGWTWNRAYEYASGEFILHLEDDQFLRSALEPDALQAAIDALRTIPRLRLIDLKMHVEGEPAGHVMQFGRWGIQRFQADFYDFSNQSRLAPKTLWTEVGRFPETFSPWSIENMLAGRFNRAGFRRARMVTRDGQPWGGWLTHEGPSTVNLPGYFGLEAEQRVNPP